MSNRWVVLALLAAGCGSKARATCEKALVRYETCVREVFGKGAAAMSDRQPTDVDGCAKDEPTVAMYDRCLPSATCTEFMDCILDVK